MSAYVPMTDDEITEATKVTKSDLLHEPTKYCWRVVEQAVLARIEQQGLVIVPREPSESIITSARNIHWEIRGCQLCSDDYMDIYKAMLEATKDGAE